MRESAEGATFRLPTAGPSGLCLTEKDLCHGLTAMAIQSRPFGPQCGTFGPLL